ncbi:MAG: hypothetical protein GY952_00110 [Rhodobacteraceae bacterium]|nr:hypothetical protein [Paracoccaceae bacterium]
MSNAHIAILILMGLAFIVWAVLWFRALFKLKRIADQRRQEAGRGYFSGMGVTFLVFAEFLTAPEHRKDRNRVGIATGAVFAIIILQLVMLH